MGTQAGIHRFVVDLGDVDLTSDGRYSFELRGLPKAHFVPYLRVSTPLVYSRADRPQTGWGLTTVQLQLHETDELVFDENRPLSGWIWSGPIDSQYSIAVGDGCRRIGASSRELFFGGDSPRIRGRFAAFHALSACGAWSASENLAKIGPPHANPSADSRPI
jgi:hypothetical protein